MTVEIRRADWAVDEPRIRAIRHEVFVIEQRVDPAIEWDGRDADCEHVLVHDGDEYMATGRLQHDGRIGRMAVRAPYRGLGHGGRVLRELLRIAAGLGLREVRLHAQVHAVTFYENNGFSCYGEVFDEAGIAHRHMRHRL